jgi:hypothetical protein
MTRDLIASFATGTHQHAPPRRRNPPIRTRLTLGEFSTHRRSTQARTPVMISQPKPDTDAGESSVRSTPTAALGLRRFACVY